MRTASLIGVSEPKVRHLWIPGGRSLCDRRDCPDASLAEMSDEDFETHVREQTAAPACGPCLIVLGELSATSSVMREDTLGEVWPPSPRDAYALLVGTHWDQLGRNADGADLDMYNLFGQEIDVERGKGNRRKYEQQLRRIRSEALADGQAQQP